MIIMDAYTNAEFEELNREFYPDATGTLPDDMAEELAEGWGDFLEATYDPDNERLEDREV